MPNGTTHRLTGMVIAVATPLFIDKNKKYSTLEVSAFAVTGFKLGRLPDILEPAFHPNHRNFFHSIIFGGLLAYGGYEIWQKIQQKKLKPKTEEFDWEEFALILLLIIIAVYLLHLILDATTKKGLPLI